MLSVGKRKHLQKIPKNFLWCGTKSPLIINDGQDAHPTRLGNLFFGVLSCFVMLSVAKRNIFKKSPKISCGAGRKAR